MSAKKLIGEARKYNSYGWVVIPLNTADKKGEGKCPMLPGWQKLTLEDKINFENAINIGVITGKASNIVCLDIDSADNGMEVWLKLLEKYGDINTPIQCTPKNGLHYIFKYENKFENLTSSSKKVKLNNKIIGIDFKSEGGCFVVSPSINRINNTKYEWKNDPGDFDEMPNMPAWIYDLLLHGNLDENYNIIKKEIIKKEYSGKIRNYENTNIVYLAELTDMLPETYFKNYDQWLELGFILYTFLKGDEEFILHVWSKIQLKHNPDDYDEDEMIKKIRSIAKSCETKNQKGLFTLEKICKEIDLEKFNEIHEKHYPVLNDKDYIDLFREDQGLCDIFIRHNGQNIKLHTVPKPDGKAFTKIFIWDENTKLWKNRTNLHIADVISHVLEPKISKILERIKYYSTINTDEEKKMNEIYKTISNIKKQVLKTIVCKRITDIVVVRDEVEDKNFIENINNKHEYLLPIIMNKVVNLKTGEILDRNREHCFSFDCPVNIETDINKINEIDNIMSQICVNNNELKIYLQTCLGYMLTASNKEAKFFIAYGTGANGKSMILKLMSKILSDFQGDISKDVVIKNKNSSTVGSHTEYLSPVKGSRLVTISETSEGDEINDTIIKNLTGDSVAYRGINQSQDKKGIKSYAKPLMITNHKPKININDGGLTRRVEYIPFLARFCENPNSENEYLINKNLEKELLEEKLNAVFTWILKGAINYYKNGFPKTPEIIYVEKDKYLTELDDIGNFIKDMCEIQDKNLNETVKNVTASDFYNEYVKYCHTNGIKPQNMIKVKNYMENLPSISRVKRSSNFIYKYISFKKEEIEE